MFFRFKKGIIGLCVAMMVAFGIVVYSGMEVSASSSAVSNNAVKDTGKSGISIKINGKVKELNKYDGSIKKSKGNAKFKKSSGYVKSEFFVYKKAVYYANSKGNLASGWEKIKGSYYFFGRTNYKMARNKSVEKVTLTKYGVAESGAKNQARAKSYAKYLDCPLVLCNKTRARANVVASMQIIGEVEGKNVVIIDDMVDTAGTITKAADLMKEHGAKTVRACASHCVMSGPASDRVQASALEEIVFTDSIPYTQRCAKVKQLSVAEMFAEAIQRVIDNKSISDLYIV
jgi:orotate phosphoribosyltransferase-like protein